MIEEINNQNFYKIKNFYKKEKETIICNLCPHNCRINNNKKGICGTRININGQFYSMVYGKVSAIHVDPIEKKPLYHFYPGEKILSIGTIGCNLFCRGCQNYEISKNHTPISEIQFISPKEIVEIAIKNNIRMIAYTYNEPTIFYEYMVDIAKLAKKHNIKNVMVSNGYINEKPLKKLLKYIDAANIDLKGFNEKFYREYANAKLEPVLKTIKIIKESKKWLEITNLIIPKTNDDLKEIKKMCIWIKENANSPLHFSRFFPYFKAADKEITPKETLFEAKKIAINTGIKYVYIGNIGFLDNTYCPKCNNLLIKRNPYIEVCGISKGKCKKCNNKIPGFFK
ncbi:MAG: AmmeMemoRadiSam system radical SAM enzyme [Candidatus Woesearchaeota archaeon]